MVSTSSVSSSVFSPDRIVGRPPSSSLLAPSCGRSWITRSRHESAIGSILQVVRDSPLRDRGFAPARAVACSGIPRGARNARLVIANDVRLLCDAVHATPDRTACEIDWMLAALIARLR